MVPPGADDDGGDRPASDGVSASAPARMPASMAEVSRAEIMNPPPYERWLVTLPDDSPELTSFSDPRVGPAPGEARDARSATRDPDAALTYTSSDDMPVEPDLEPLPSLTAPRAMPRGGDWMGRVAAKNTQRDLVIGSELLSDEGKDYVHGIDEHGRYWESKFGIDSRGIGARLKEKYGVDIKDLTRELAIAIYDKEVWSKTGAHAPTPLDRLILDGEVQHPKAAATILQEALNALNPSNPVKVDGKLGPQTLAAVGRVNDPQTLADMVIAGRRQYYRGLPDYRVRTVERKRPDGSRYYEEAEGYGAGWENRMDRQQENVDRYYGQNPFEQSFGPAPPFERTRIYEPRFQPTSGWRSQPRYPGYGR